MRNGPQCLDVSLTQQYSDAHGVPCSSTTTSTTIPATAAATTTSAAAATTTTLE